MNKATRKKIEDAGWRNGSAYDFLNLKESEVAYVEFKIRLSKILKENRVKHHVTQTQLAKMLQSSQSRVAKMEAGDPSVSLDLLVRSLFSLSASPGSILKMMPH